jgi:hypothetical protein
LFEPFEFGSLEIVSNRVEIMLCGPKPEGLSMKLTLSNLKGKSVGRAKHGALAKCESNFRVGRRVGDKKDLPEGRSEGS